MTAHTHTHKQGAPIHPLAFHTVKYNNVYFDLQSLTLTILRDPSHVPEGFGLCYHHAHAGQLSLWLFKVNIIILMTLYVSHVVIIKFIRTHWYLIMTEYLLKIHRGLFIIHVNND